MMPKYCPKCGSETVDGAYYCKRCGSNLIEDQKDYKLWIILGYILAIVFPLFGAILAIFLYTRKSENAKRHSKFIIIIAVIVWIISFII